MTATLSGGAAPTGSVTFKNGATTLGTIALSGTTAPLTTSALPVGSAVIVAIYSGDANNAAATSARATINVAARPNPALNADVTGLVAAEASVAVRYGETQIGHVVRRLEEIHDDETDGAGTTAASRAGSAAGAASEGPTPVPSAADGASAGIRSRSAALGPYGSLPSGSDRALAYADVANPQRDAQSQTGQAIAALTATFPTLVADLNRRGDLPFHIWYAGSVQFGALNVDNTYSNRFTSSGLTIGFDRAFTDRLRAGIAFGGGLDHTSVGTDGTQSNSFAYNATLYGTYRVWPHTFLDAVAGYGRMDFSLDRWSADGTTMLGGDRKGSDAFGAISLTEDVRFGAWRVAPYGRFDLVRYDLGAYSKTGSDVWDLHYGRLTSTTLSAVAGTRVGYTFLESWGTVEPSFRLEYRHALTGSYDQFVNYANLPGVDYRIFGLPQGTDLLTGGAELRVVSLDGFSAEVEYLMTTSFGQFEGKQIRLRLGQSF